MPFREVGRDTSGGDARHPRVGRRSEVERDHHALVLDEDACYAERSDRVSCFAAHHGHPISVRDGLFREVDLSADGTLCAMHTPDLNAFPQPLHQLFGRATGNDRHQSEPARKRLEKAWDAFERRRFGRVGHDLRERAVVIQEQAGGLWFVAKGAEISIQHPARLAGRMLAYTALMRTSLTVATVAAAALLAACRPDTVALNYRFPTGNEIRYRMEARADASWELSGRGQGTYRAVFEVTERVLETSNDGALVSVVMTPIDVDEEGLPSPGLDERSFTLRAGPNGEVLEVIEVDGVPAGALDNDQIGLIATYRPPLPLEPTTLNGTWNADQELELPSVFQQVTTIGRLTRLDRDAQGRTAQLDYSGSGPLVRSIALPQGQADLTGSTEIAISAHFDIDRGLLRGATSSTTGRFDVRVLPPDRRAPIVGNLRLDLDVELTQIGAR